MSAWARRQLVGLSRARKPAVPSPMPATNQDLGRRAGAHPPNLNFPPNLCTQAGLKTPCPRPATRKYVLSIKVLSYLTLMAIRTSSKALFTCRKFLTVNIRAKVTQGTSELCQGQERYIVISGSRAYCEKNS